MNTVQQTMKDRGFEAIKDPSPDSGENDIAICKIPINRENPDVVVRIKYSEVLQRNTAQEKLDFILSKLPNE